jgi:RNA polymerase sigma factor (sigma-70 family)
MPSKLSEISNSELLALCLNSPDKEPAWEEFVRRFHQVIVSAVIKTYKNMAGVAQDDPIKEVVEDLTQMVYTKLIEGNYRALRNFKGEYENSIYRFLMLVAANVVRDHFRQIRAHRRSAVKIPLEELIGSSDSLDVSVSAFTSGELSWADIEAALEKVCNEDEYAQDKLIIKLHYLYGFTFEEIVKMLNLGVKPASLNSRVSRKMKKVIEELGLGPRLGK